MRLSLTGVIWFGKSLGQYRRMQKALGVTVPITLFPQVFDRDPSSHTFDKHYVYMDKWAFEQLLANRPHIHIDVGSSIRFLSMATSIVPVTFVDIRPISVDFKNFECKTGSILSMPFADNSVQSLSCLHVAEHIGLGRYGDLLDPKGTEKACKELARVLAPGGKIYFALPIGKTMTYFNAHRVHDPELICSYFPDLTLMSFAVVGDEGHFIPAAKMDQFKNAQYACGMFIFTKDL